MIWPDGVTYISDGFMYSGAAQLIQTGAFQSNATPSGTANNAPAVPDLSIPAGGGRHAWLVSRRPCAGAAIMDHAAR